MRLGIMSAMTEEIDLLLPELAGKATTTVGMRDYHQGRLWGVDSVVAFSRWGKVAAASTATELISRHRVDAILFTGVAGGVAAGVKVGDVVIGNELVQHDLDARPLFDRHEVPLLGRATFETDPGLRARLEAAARGFVKEGSVHVGLIASGDQFFASAEKVRELRSRLPGVLCVEMEGAAVAQVCHEHGVPFAIARVISDSADEQAPVDFPKFVRDVARVYSHGILRALCTERELTN